MSGVLSQLVAVDSVECTQDSWHCEDGTVLAQNATSTSSLPLLAIGFKSRSINYFLEKFYNVFFLVYKERERMFFSEFSRTEWLFVTRGTLPLSFFSLHCKKIPGVYYYIINCRLHFVGWKALNTQMRFQYLLSGAQRTELSNLVIVYS